MKLSIIVVALAQKRFIVPITASIAAVVFDGYSSSTKDHEHRRRNKIFSASIEITEDTRVTVPRSNVLANRHNKSSLTKLLARYLSANGLMTKLSCEDADTLVVELLWNAVNPFL